eukprot:9348_1
MIKQYVLFWLLMIIKSRANPQSIYASKDFYHENVFNVYGNDPYNPIRHCHNFKYQKWGWKTGVWAGQTYHQIDCDTTGVYNHHFEYVFQRNDYHKDDILALKINGEYYCGGTKYFTEILHRVISAVHYSDSYCQCTEVYNAACKQYMISYSDCEYAYTCWECQGLTCEPETPVNCWDDVRKIEYHREFVYFEKCPRDQWIHWFPKSGTELWSVSGQGNLTATSTDELGEEVEIYETDTWIEAIIYFISSVWEKVKTSFK